jgi:hypothetical protein
VSDLGAAAETIIASHLWAGERVLWCERPASGGAVAVAGARRGAYQALGAAAGIVFVTFRLFDALKREPGAQKVVMVLGGVGLAGAVAWGALRSSVQARRQISATAYAVTSRRVILVRGEDVEWIGDRDLDSCTIRGRDLVIHRGRKDMEDVTLAGLRDPAPVVAAIQTLRSQAAS